MRGLGFADADSLAKRQASWLARADTVVVAPPPVADNLSATAAWESALATQLLGALEGFPDADMDVILDVRERISGSRLAFRAALHEAAKDLADRGVARDPADVESAIRDLRIGKIEPALDAIRDDLESLKARRWLLRAVGNSAVTSAAAALTIVVTTAIGGPLLGASGGLLAALVTAAGSEAEYRHEQRAALRQKPFMVLYKTAEAFRTPG